VHRLSRRSNSESYRYLLQFRGRHTHRAFTYMCLLDADEGAVFSSLKESFPYRVWKVKPVGES
jgi:hypothetical protein